ncbi:hypothetical protein Tco_1213007 [Tanacetum coccineum]
MIEREESSGTESEVQDDSSRSGNDTDVDDADIKPIYDEEPMAEIQEKVFAIAALKNDLRKLKGNSVDTKFAKTSVLGKPVLQSLRKQSVVRQPNAFKSERPQMSKPRFASQVDVNNNLSRPCIFNANHDACITTFLKEVNSRATIQSNKTRNSNKPIEKKSHTQKPSRHIFKGHRFSPNKTSGVYKKTSPRSDLRWKPTGRIFKTVGLRWVPTGKILSSYTSKDDSEPTHGSNVDIPNIHESKQTLDLSAGTSINVQKEQSFDLSAGTSNNVKPDNLRVCWKVYSVICSTNISNGENQVVSKSSAVTTADASDKRQQQPDSTLSTSTLATTVTADGNFDL